MSLYTGGGAKLIIGGLLVLRGKYLWSPGGPKFLPWSPEPKAFLSLEPGQICWFWREAVEP